MRGCSRWVTLTEYSRALIRLHQRIEGAAPTVTERQALTVLGDGALKHQFVVGVRKEWVRRELRRLMWRLADKPFIVVWGEALRLMCEEEDRVVQMRPVEISLNDLEISLIHLEISLNDLEISLIRSI